jgi:carboxylate-amine ligase
VTATFGIEEEFLVVDPASGALSTLAPEVLAMAQPVLGEQVTSELNRCQVETNSAVCDTLEQASAELGRLRRGLTESAGRANAGILALSTHPWSAWHDQQVNTDTEHYRQLLNTYQQIARQQVICGCHIHVQVDDPDQRIAAMNRVRPWLPVLLALSANSPWWQGSDTGYNSYRTLVWRAWPTATFPPTLDDYDAYQRLLNSLEKIEAIDSPAAIYWHVRPSAKLPTLEYRVCDVCLRLEDSVTLGGLVRALTTAAADSKSANSVLGAPVLDSALWRAARYGLDGPLVDPSTQSLRPGPEVVEHLLDAVGPALHDSGDYERVVTGVKEILGRGSGARFQRQRLAVDHTPEAFFLETAAATISPD